MKTKLLVPLLVLATFSACKHDLIAPAKTTLKVSSSRHLAAVETDFQISSASASSTNPGFSTSSAYDGNPGSIWSSNTASTNHQEYFQFFFSQFQTVNVVKLTPRFGSGAALGFPVTFSIYYSDGSNWILCYQYVNVPTPPNTGHHQFPVILPLPGPVYTNGFKIIATQLGKDDVNNYVFQLAEIAAGYNADWLNFNFIGNDGTYAVNRINNAGSSSFDPNKALNFTMDERYPLIAASGGNYRNIYAPSIVNNGGSAWNIYFGGWDVNSTTKNDNVYFTVTHDDFMNFDNHARLISYGNMAFVNNPSALKISSNFWLMNVTDKPANGPNKPMYAVSTDGWAWSPNYGTAAYYLNMSNYPNWSNADVNGSNVLFVDMYGQYNLFFTDFNSSPLRIHHAVSTEGVNYTYVGDVNSTDAWICTDVKSFTNGSTTYYYAVSHGNTNTVRFNLSTDLSTWPTSNQMFGNFGTNDQYITSVALVAANNRLYGVLYGAGPNSNLEQNSIYALWLTKKITFVSDETGATWGGNGNAERSHGPNQVVLPMGATFTTGHYEVYDTDGYTLLYTSPQLSIRSGDVWSYQP